jgi:hypothetical protein
MAIITRLSTVELPNKSLFQKRIYGNPRELKDASQYRAGGPRAIPDIAHASF